MSPITTHVLNTGSGCPAEGVTAQLALKATTGWITVAWGETDSDGRISSWMDSSQDFQTGIYRIVFETGAYFSGLQQTTFYPQAQIVFQVDDANQHYHVPLLLNRFGYSTYRGS